MRILYLAFVRLPTEKAHGVQIVKTCEALATQGAELELVIPGRKTTVLEDPFTAYNAQHNFVLTSLATPDWVRFGPIGFIISALWFSEAAKLRKSFWTANVIYSRDALVLLQYLLLGRKLVYEAHTRPTFVSRIVAKRCYKLIVISEGLRDAYLARGIPKEKVTVAHDAVDPEAFQQSFDMVEERKKLGIPLDKKVALYIGRIDAAKGTDTFAAASEYVSNDVACVLIGAGPLKGSLQKKYPKALFLPETPYRDLPRVLSVADVLVLPNSARDVDAAQYTSPMKAFAYLASRKPIIASDVPALRGVLKSEGVSFFLPDAPESLANVLNDTFPKTITRAKTHSWEKRGETIYNTLTSLNQ